ncbi:MAG: DUF5612 domain-containing protein, partial [Chloroflexi bacterium]|nr:DUF5612 domain-containing protein [Chloroflexota bacterium]
MARRSTLPATVAVRVVVDDVAASVPALIDRLGTAGGILRTLSTVRRLPEPVPAAPARGDADGGSADAARVEIEIEVEGLDQEQLVRTVHATPGVRAHRVTRSLDRIFGKRVIVIGGGAQVAQVALGAVSEADRHNLRGERISVDTIALVGEQEIAAAVRAVADLPRARLLVLAGSIMGGDITTAARELQAQGLPIICLNMAGSITEVADLVVSDPVQAGTMAVMAIADTATFDL